MFDNDDALWLRAQVIRDAVASTLDGIMPSLCRLRDDGKSELEEMLVAQLRGADRQVAADLLVDLVFTLSSMPDDMDAALTETIRGETCYFPHSTTCH